MGSCIKYAENRQMNETFLKKLQAEAQQQQKLYTSRIIPKAFDPLTSFIGENTLLFLTCLSVFTAVFLEIVKKL